ncbi:MAG: hypothetical protein PHF00_02285 [Elusimicrobia bacterium]|nr:hypothetical protein [Elusimicrobiota bacterium]
MELVFDFFEDHVKAAAAVKARRPLALGVLCFMLGALGFFTAQELSGRLVLLPFGGIGFALFLLWELGAGLVMVAVLHLIADFQGRPGSASELFVLFGMAQLVWGLAVPAVLVLLALAPTWRWPAGAAFLLLGLASLSLKARSIQDTYQVSLGRAWFNLILPYLALLLASGLAFLLAAAGLFMRFAEALNG